MTEQEEIKILRDLVDQHCAWCVDCMYTEIPKTGLLETDEYRPDPDDPAKEIRYNENATCQFAQYWDKLATDEVWRGSPCHTCYGCPDSSDPEPFRNRCSRYQEWVNGLEDWERRRCAEHFTKEVKHEQ